MAWKPVTVRRTKAIALVFCLLCSAATSAAQAPPRPPPAGAVVSQQALAQIDSLLAEKRSRTATQRKIDSQLIYAARIAAGRAIAAAVPALRVRLPTAQDGRVVLDIRAAVTDALLNQLTALGARVTDTDVRYHHVGVEAPLALLDAIAAIPEVDAINPEYGWMTSRSLMPGLMDIRPPPRPASGRRATHLPSETIASLQAAVRFGAQRLDPGPLFATGSVTSQGDRTHRAADARAAFAVTGSGVKIGVLSDGVSSLAASQASGNLGPVTVLAAGAGDEGTAMLEIIADLAPGAQLYFATANGGPTTFAQHIRDLRAAGCDIIVDDVLYFVETTFQDGQIGPSATNGGVIVQAVRDVTAAGALYFSAAGNSGRLDAATSGTWEGDFVGGGPASGVLAGAGELHQFGSSTFNTIVSTGGTFNTLSWSDPLGASSNDYDLFLLDSTGTQVLEASTDTQNGTQDPFEWVSGGDDNDRLVVVRVSGQGRYLHLATNRGVLAVATSGEVHGHAATNSPTSFAVAATPACAGAGSNGPCTTSFTAANQVETFSSDGPRRIFFDAAGVAITPGDFSSTGGTVLAKPDFTAADGVLTSVPDFSPFYGTSAAAPHAAAIAALARSASPQTTPAQIAALLRSTAIDIQTAGWDRDAGYGIAMAYDIVAALAPSPALATPTGLALVRTGPTSAVASWNPVTGATSYAVKVGTTAGGPKTTRAVVSGTSAQLTGLTRGQTYYVAVSASNGSSTSNDSIEVVYVVPLVDNQNDFDADGLADLVVWRPGNGTWFWLTSQSGYDAAHASAKQWGVSTDTPFTGDIDGDGKADLIVWRPSTGTWFWITSTSGYSYANQGSKQWGLSTDVPLVGDIDGDGRVDLIVWRPGSGTWFWLLSSSGYDYAAQGSVQWGDASLGDRPLVGDFDGDGRADPAVWRASTGIWYWLLSSSSYSYASQSAKAWGKESEQDVPLLADVDGDARADLVVWRASTGTWFWLTSSSGYDYAAQGMRTWGSGALNDVPALADLDGDRRADLIVWRPSTGVWFWLTSSSGYNSAAQKAWGSSGDIPMIR